MISLKDWCPDMDKAFPTWEAQWTTCFLSYLNMHADMPRWTSITGSDVQKWRTCPNKRQLGMKPFAQTCYWPVQMLPCRLCDSFLQKNSYASLFEISQEQNWRVSRKELRDQYQDLFVLIHKVFLLCAKICVRVLKALGLEIKPMCYCCTLFINKVYRWVDKDSTRSLANGN
jgi:hypothetical protein